MKEIRRGGLSLAYSAAREARERALLLDVRLTKGVQIAADEESAETLYHHMWRSSSNGAELQTHNLSLNDEYLLRGVMNKPDKPSSPTFARLISTIVHKDRSPLFAADELYAQLQRHLRRRHYHNFAFYPTQNPDEYELRPDAYRVSPAMRFKPEWYGVFSLFHEATSSADFAKAFRVHADILGALVEGLKDVDGSTGRALPPLTLAPALPLPPYKSGLSLE